jgi:hypothetical protein
MVIASVKQNDIRTASLQGASRGDPSKSDSDDHDSLSPMPGASGMGELSYLAADQLQTRCGV